MAALPQTFSALSDPVRFAMVERLLAEGELPAGRLGEGFGISAPAVSQHLGVLREAGLEPRELHRDIRIRDNGDMRYVFNYGPETVDVLNLVDTGSVLFGETQLAPRGVLAIRKT